MKWLRDPAFWVVLISFSVFLATAFSILYSYESSPRGKRLKSALFSRSRIVKTADESFRVRRVTIDARSYTKWVYYRFSRGVVRPRYVSSLNWDLAFKRYHIIANGGSANLAAQGGILDYGNGDLSAIHAIPVHGYVPDTPTPDGRDSENLAIRHWYLYDYGTHVLTPKPDVYLVRTPDQHYYGLRILSYYCSESQAPDSGYLTFEYRKLR